MRNLIGLFLAASFCCVSLGSCKKYYDCVCVDPMGKNIEAQITAKNKTEAEKNCKDLSRISTCTVTQK